MKLRTGSKHGKVICKVKKKAKTLSKPLTYRGSEYQLYVLATSIPGNNNGTQW